MGNGQMINPIPMNQPPQEAICAVCKKTWQYQPPQAQIGNFQLFSQAVWVHEKSTRCPHCFQTHIFVVGNISIGWALMPSKETPDERVQIITPGR